MDAAKHVASTWLAEALTELHHLSSSTQMGKYQSLADLTVPSPPLT